MGANREPLGNMWIYVDLYRCILIYIDILMLYRYMDIWTLNSKWDMWLRSGHGIHNGIFGLEVDIEFKMGYVA